jgi:hypothetical protein
MGGNFLLYLMLSNRITFDGEIVEELLKSDDNRSE